MIKSLAILATAVLSVFSANAQRCSMGYAERIKGATNRQQALSVAEQAESYLYTPGSEGYDESTFIAVLHALLQSPWLTNDDKMRPAAQLALASKNLPGQKAADFSFVTPDGNCHRLSDVNTPFTIIFFNDPECDDCAAIKQQIGENNMLQQLVTQKKLTIICLYPFDDEALWRSTSYPANVVNGWDSTMQIESTESYVLLQMPSLYLLGADMQVLKKNATLSCIISYLQHYSAE